MTRLDPTRLVFVAGLHRSGTTPFARLLAAHPDVCGISGSPAKEDEGQHLQSVYPKAKVHGGSGRFAYAAAAHLTEASPLVTAANADAIVASWEPYWDMSKSLLVEKSPPNIIMGRFLQACFPGSAFIAVVRHPVTVALSNKKWRRLASANPRKFQSLTGLVDHWMTAHRILRNDLPRLDRALVIYYEDLVDQPQQTLARVESFLHLDRPLDGSMLSAAHSTAYAQRWDSYRNLARPGGWQRRLIESRFGEAMGSYGYDSTDLFGHRKVAADPLAQWSGDATPPGRGDRGEGPR